MKILYHHRIASKDGQYVHVEEIIKALRANGCEVNIVAPDLVEKQSFGGDGGWVSKLKAHLPGAVYELMELTYSAVSFAKLARSIVRDRPDVIYERFNLYSIAGCLASKLFKIPLILEVNAPLLEERAKYNGIALQRLAKWTQSYTWRNADVVLPVTQVLADIVKSYGVEHSRIEVIHNGIDRNAFKPKRFTESNELTVGFVGFVREWHRLDYLVELMAKPDFSHIRLAIIGEGPAIPQIKRLAALLKVEQRINITGLIDRASMPEQLEKIDIAIQPSVVAYASPLKLIEYLGCGLAIVAPAQPNIEELLTDGVNALLFKPDNPQACANSIAKIAADPELRKTLSVAAADTIEEKQLLWLKNASKIERFAEQLLTKGTIEQSKVS